MIKKVSLTPSIFHLPEAVNKISQKYYKNPIMLCGPEFTSLMIRLKKKITDAFEVTDTHKSVLFQSSGSGAIAATIGCCVDKEGILVVSNGAYGERIANFSRVCGHQTYHYELEYGQKPDIEKIESLLLAHRPSSIGIVHGATSTCNLNPLGEISELTKRYGLKLFVDCISSSFVDDILVKEWDIDLLISSSNKGLHSTPGISFVLIKKSFIEEVKRFLPKTPYFNLIETFDKQNKNEFPFTVDPRIVLEMDAALDEFNEKGGLEGRKQLYQERNQYLRKEYERLELEIFTELDMPLQNIGTALKIPEFTDYPTLAKHLEQNREYNESYVICAAQSKLSDSVFRIFNMGEYEMQSYRNFIDILEKTLKKLKA